MIYYEFIFNPNHPIIISFLFIQIPRRDFFFGKNGRATCFSFLRSRRVQHPGMDCDKIPDVENANTAWLDLSHVYGSDEEKVM